MVCVTGTQDTVINCQVSNLSCLFFALTPLSPSHGLRNENIPNILEDKILNREVEHQKRDYFTSQNYQLLLRWAPPKRKIFILI